MWPVFADPKTGFVFKRIFGAEDRKHLLIGLLNALLELDDAHRIVEVQHLPAEQRIAINELKLSILDVKCTDATGTRCGRDAAPPRRGVRETGRLQRRQGVRDAAPRGR